MDFALITKFTLDTPLAKAYIPDKDEAIKNDASNCRCGIDCLARCSAVHPKIQKLIFNLFQGGTL